MRSLFLGLLAVSSLIVPTVGQCAANQAAATQVEEPATHKTFPRQVSFNFDGKDYKLDITGVAVRKKFFINIYAMASYMQNPPAPGSDIFQEILNDDSAKQIVSNFAHSATVKQIRDGYIESFHKVLNNEQFANLRKEIDQFIGFFQEDVKVDDVHAIRWIPGGTVELYIQNEKKGSITNPAFPKALWSIWFGPKSILDRDKLVSFIKADDGKTATKAY